jgi:hypothetical protein
MNIKDTSSPMTYKVVGDPTDGYYYVTWADGMRQWRSVELVRRDIRNMDRLYKEAA